MLLSPLMCYLTSLNPLVTCADNTGGYTRLLAHKADLNPADWTIGTGVTRHTLTALANDSLVDWIEIFPDFTKDASAASEQTRGKRSYVHTIIAFITGDNFENERIIGDGDDCCGYVFLVEHGTGNWFAYGVNYNKKTGTVKSFANMQVQASATTDVSGDAEGAGTTLTFSKERVLYSRLPVAPAVIGTITIEPFAP